MGCEAGSTSEEAAQPPGKGGGVRITWLGHSTLLLELDGIRILTDPVLGDRLGPLRRHGASPAMAAIGELDAVLISHAHPDHFNSSSLRRLGGPARRLVPHGLGAAARRLGSPVDELRVGDVIEIGGVRVTAVPALHLRWPLRPHAITIGFLIEGSTGIYFAGDTRFFPSMAVLSGRVDVALLPVGRWGPHPGPDRLGPASAAQAARVVGASVAIPVHWGTFYPAGFWRVWPRPLREPAARFVAAMAALAPEIEVRLLQPGDSTDVTRPGGSRR